MTEQQGKECESCSMVMTMPDDHGGGDLNNARCINCCHPDGSHKSRDEVLQGTIDWLLSDRCAQAGFPKAISTEEARERAEEILLEKPIWR